MQHNYDLVPSFDDLIKVRFRVRVRVKVRVICCMTMPVPTLNEKGFPLKKKIIVACYTVSPNTRAI